MYIAFGPLTVGAHTKVMTYEFQVALTGLYMAIWLLGTNIQVVLVVSLLRPPG